MVEKLCYGPVNLIWLDPARISAGSAQAKESLKTKTIDGIAESVQDAVQFKFLPAPLSQDQLSELIRIPSGS